MKAFSTHGPSDRNSDTEAYNSSKRIFFTAISGCLAQNCTTIWLFMMYLYNKPVHIYPYCMWRCTWHAWVGMFNTTFKGMYLELAFRKLATSNATYRPQWTLEIAKHTACCWEVTTHVFQRRVTEPEMPKMIPWEESYPTTVHRFPPIPTDVHQQSAMHYELYLLDWWHRWFLTALCTFALLTAHKLHIGEPCESQSHEDQCRPITKIDASIQGRCFFQNEMTTGMHPTECIPVEYTLKKNYLYNYN